MSYTIMQQILCILIFYINISQNHEHITQNSTSRKNTGTKLIAPAQVYPPDSEGLGQYKIVSHNQTPPLGVNLLAAMRKLPGICHRQYITTKLTHWPHVEVQINTVSKSFKVLQRALLYPS